MVWQAYIDDSYTPEGTFVLGGYIATAENWAKFAKEWNALLPSGGTLANNGRYHFKMSEMSTTPQRMERVPAFYWIIERHVHMAVSCKINIADLKRARARIWVPNLRIDWGFWTNPYLTSVRCLLDMFHTHKATIDTFIPLEDKIDFIFDNQTERSMIRAAWDRYLSGRPANIKSFYGAAPRFEDDQQVLPLQAADFWAWWVRKWYDQNDDENAGRQIAECDFGSWRGARIFPRLAISFDENQLAESMTLLMREMIEPGRIIYDVRFSWRGP